MTAATSTARIAKADRTTAKVSKSGPVTSNLTGLVPTPAPKATKPAKVAKVSRPCGCGCGVPTVRPEAAYLSGHDARHAGVVGRRLLAGKVADIPEFAALVTEFNGSTKLADKAMGFVASAHARTARKATEQAARKVAQAAAKAAYAKALATA